MLERFKSPETYSLLIRRLSRYERLISRTSIHSAYVDVANNKCDVVVVVVLDFDVDISVRITSPVTHSKTRYLFYSFQHQKESYYHTQTGKTADDDII